MGISPLSNSGSPVFQYSTISAVQNNSTTATPAQPAASATPGTDASGADKAPIAAVPPPGSGKARTPDRPIVNPSKIGPEFQWNDTANRLVVVMMDRSTGDVVQQLPPQQVLDLVQEAIEQTLQKIDERAGAGGTK
jgi:FlaG protein